MRDMRHGICAVCDHPEVINAPAVEYSEESNPVRLAVTHAPDELDLLETKLSIDRPLGALRLLVCRSCGFVQWFASKPSRIPIDETHGTRLITPKPSP